MKNNTQQKKEVCRKLLTHTFKCIHLLLIVILLPFITNAQNNIANEIVQDLDSLWLLFSKAKSEKQINLANEICALAYQREFVNTEWKFSSDDKPDKISSQTHYCMSSYAISKGDYQNALYYIQEGIKIDERQKDSTMLARDYHELGKIYDRINQMEKCISSFEKSIKISAEIGDKANEARTLYSLGSFYLRHDRHDIGLQTMENVLSLAKKLDNKRLTASCLSMIGEFHLQHGDKEVALENITQSVKLRQEIGTPKMLESGFCLLGMAQTKLGQYKEAEINLLKALEMSKEMDDKYSIAFDLMVLGDLKNEQNLIKEADRYYMQSIDQCFEIQDFNLISVISKKLYKLHREENPVVALQWLEKNAHLTDSIFNLEMHNQISAYQISYETEKKEAKIAALNEEKRLMTGLSIAGGGLLLLGLVTLFFLWRWTVQKRRLAEKQHELAETHIKQLEQEKQLVATQAVLDGEVRERSRLARDLHDGLGGKLTGMKLKLQELKHDAKFDHKELEQFDKAMEMLDESVQEMRRVSHNLMPDALLHFGLKQAVDDFCRSMSSQIFFNYYGDESRLDTKLEILIYRCIHELVNNALKYSGATQIMVQIVREQDSISFTVQDDGCGFDPDAATKGTGLQNIRTRVASFGGDLQIDSKTGEGTEVNGELRIES